ncbi:hypothetical protein ACWD28_22130, partial [Streptomyces sp. NPDC002746]
RRARERGWTTVRALPPGTVITMEFLGGRINVAQGWLRGEVHRAGACVGLGVPDHYPRKGCDGPSA